MFYHIRCTERHMLAQVEERQTFAVVYSKQTRMQAYLALQKWADSEDLEFSWWDSGQFISLIEKTLADGQGGTGNG